MSRRTKGSHYRWETSPRVDMNTGASVSEISHGDYCSDGDDDGCSDSGENKRLSLSSEAPLHIGEQGIVLN
ncbi:hypothetical protein PoB_005245900 [Plakobranchus ocellatus]|uniref:Uncharacterized protein n=1 Tax=Plakobranchus ocellatus TaxID=259542 RepID=A0AAV4C0A9_9GAST|nr:hypothetical protein PoB_005245900 [Plakobranchus ocellatus]